jgi:hypothetical protein
MRLRRANAKVKKDPIPGRVRTRKWRESLQKQKITPVEFINTNETAYVPSAIFESHSVLPQPDFISDTHSTHPVYNTDVNTSFDTCSTAVKNLNKKEREMHCDQDLCMPIGTDPR